MHSMSTAIGIDIGGSHITAALVSLENGKIVSGTRSRAAVNAHATADEILDIWTATIREVMKKAQGPITQIGFAMPGPFDYDKGISQIKNLHKYDGLYGLS